MIKNTGSQVIGCQMVSASDGSAFTGSVTVAVTIDAGTQATGSVGSGACAHEGNGYHTYAPAQAETNGNILAFTFTGTGAVPVTIQVFTISYNPHDTVRLGLTALPNAAADAAGGLPISDAGGLDLDAQVGTKINSILDDTDLIDDGTSGLAKIATDVAAILVDTADMQPKLGTPVTDISADIAAIEAQTDDIGVAGAGLTALASAVNLATVAGYLDTEIAAIKAVTDALPDAGALTSLATAAALGTVDTVVDAIKVTTDKVDDTLEDQGGGTFGFTEAALQEAPTGGSAPTAGEIADAVWEEAIADHEGTVGSTAEALADAGGAGASAADIADAVLDEALSGHTTAGSLGKAIADIEADATAILEDTAEIGAAGAGLTNINLPNQTMDIVGNITGNLSGSVGSVTGAVGSVTGNVGGNVTGSVGSLATQAKADVNAEADTALADAGVTTTVTGRIDAAVSTRATPAQVATELATYDAPTKAELDSAVAALATAAGLSTAQTAITAIKAITDALTAAAAAKLAASALGLITGTIDTAGFAATTTEFEADDITEATADHYVGRIITFTSGALLGQATDITDYALASGRGHFTTTALTEAPSNNDTFVIS